MSKNAQKTFENFCKMLDSIKWKYDKDPDKLTVRTSAIGEDLKIPLFFCASKDREVAYIKSSMPFQTPESARGTMATALHIANYSMLNGCFEYDQTDGEVNFKIVVPFFDGPIGEKSCNYMLMLTCQMVDKFNDKLLDVINNRMTLDELYKFAHQD